MVLSAAAVLVCVLDLLARQASSFPPIILLDDRPADVTATAEAFVRRNPDTIYFMTTSKVFQRAMAGNTDALKKVASILVHEEWHVRNGPDERGAYQAQLGALYLLGVDPGRPLSNEVRRSMRIVLDVQKRAAQQIGN